MHELLSVVVDVVFAPNALTVDSPDAWSGHLHYVT